MTLHPTAISPARTALLLIDCQADFGAPGGEMAKRGADVTSAQAALAKAQALADAARAAGVPVIFVRLLTGGEPGPCIEGTPGADFIGPQPRPGERIVTKSRFSAFSRTGLAEQLLAQNIDTLILAGLTTECCIASSAWDAFERDFHVFIARDACAAYEDDLHQGTLKALQHSGAILGDTEDFAQSWKIII